MAPGIPPCALRPAAAGRAALLVLALGACRSHPPRVLAEPAEPPFGGTAEDAPLALEYRVGPGDVLRVNVYGHPDLSSAPYESGVAGTPVEPGGTVQLPLIGALPVAGLTIEGVSAAVTESLRRYVREPRVDVAVVRFGAHRYLVLGEVREPGAYVLERPITAMEALASSGGFGPYANRAQVAWVRGGLSAENVEIFDASELDPLAAHLVQPGDILFVGRKGWADVAEASRDLIPILQVVTTPISIGLQAATVSKLQ